MADPFPPLFFFTLGLAVLASGYRVALALLARPIYAMPNRVAAHLIILFWTLATISYLAWYLADLKPLPTP